MENELDKTVSIFSKGKKQLYKIIICQENHHDVYTLNDFDKKEITFGRANSNDIVIKSNIISNFHGKFILEDGLQIVDNNSTNGLFINGESKTKSILSDGDVIKIDNPDESLEQRVIITVCLNENEIEKCPNCNENLLNKAKPIIVETTPKKEEVEKLEENKEKVPENPKEEKKFNNEPKQTDICLKCGAKMGPEEEFCSECGTKKGEVSKNKCSKCGAILEENKKFCSKCGAKVKKINLQSINLKGNKQSSKKKKIFIIVFIILIVILLVAGLIIKNAVQTEEPVKVDISMTEYSGTIEVILSDLGLDFDLVTMGANCYTGVRSATFETEKYGVLHTEYRYCKANKTQNFRVYNTEQDQKLRNPKAGELPAYDEYGYRNSTMSS